MHIAHIIQSLNCKTDILAIVELFSSFQVPHSSEHGTGAEDERKLKHSHAQTSEAEPIIASSAESWSAQICRFSTVSRGA